MAAAADFTVRFWGVRGGIPTADAATRRFGGNTPCLEVRCGAHLLIFDAGTGIRRLGASLAGGGSVDADIFFTHGGFERVCGLPFFAPGYDPGNRFAVWAAAGRDEPGIRARLNAFMTSPLFPIPLSYIGSLKSWCDFRAGDVLTPREGIRIRTAPLGGTEGAVAYRVEYGRRALCYLGAEAPAGAPDAGLRALTRGADAAIHPLAAGDGANTGAAASGEGDGTRSIVFLHSPDHDDARLDALQQALEAGDRPVTVAREGMVVAV